MAATVCPSCGGALQAKSLGETPAAVCASCGGAFLEGPAWARLVAAETAQAGAPTPVGKGERPPAPPSPWSTRNLVVHLVVLSVLGLGASATSSSAALLADLPGLDGLLLVGFVAYAGLTTFLALAARRIRFASLLVHAPALFWVLKLGTGPVVDGAVAWVREATKPPPIEAPGRLTLREWRAFPTSQAQVVFDQTFGGSLVIEALEGTRGDEVALHLVRPVGQGLGATHVSALLPVELHGDAPPRHTRLAVLVYPPKRERPCSVGPNGEPVGEAPIERLVFDSDVHERQKLGPQPHECGPVDTVAFPLMAPAQWLDH